MTCFRLLVVPSMVYVVIRPLGSWVRRSMLLPVYAYVVRFARGFTMAESRLPLRRIVQMLPLGFFILLTAPAVSYCSLKPSGCVSVQEPSPFWVRALNVLAGGRYLPLPSLP